ncbi:MAG: MFS transporter, partial [Pseudomonadota bacterium]
AIPILTPLAAIRTDLPAEAVGYLASAVAAGALGFYLVGAGAVSFLGPIRALQTGVVLSAFASLLFLTDVWWLFVLASLAIGVGLGMNMPASSVLLASVVPNNRINTAFSIKQAAVPAGGLIAGLCLPLLSVHLVWWAPIALLVTLGLAVTGLGQVFRREFDRQSKRADDCWKRPRILDTNLVLRLSHMRRLLLAGMLFAVAQGCVSAFMVTYMVFEIKQSLALSGVMYSLNHFLGMGGRILAGWVADRYVPAALALRLLSLLSGLSIIVLAGLGDETSTFAVVVAVALVGLLIGSWNGIFLAHIAQVTELDHIAVATNSSAIAIFLGFLIGPAAFAALLVLSEDYLYAFLVPTMAVLAAAFLVPGWREHVGTLRP